MTKQEKEISPAGAEPIPAVPRRQDLDICACGDFRRDHGKDGYQDHNGCRICSCKGFRFSRHSDGDEIFDQERLEERLALMKETPVSAPPAPQDEHIEQELVTALLRLEATEANHTALCDQIDRLIQQWRNDPTHWSQHRCARALQAIRSQTHEP